MDKYERDRPHRVSDCDVYAHNSLESSTEDSKTKLSIVYACGKTLLQNNKRIDFYVDAITFFARQTMLR